MKKLSVLMILLVAVMGLTACSFSFNLGNSDDYDGYEDEIMAENDGGDWSETSLARIAFVVKDSWNYEPFYSENEDEYEGVGYEVRDKEGMILFTINVFREGDTTAEKIVTTDDYNVEEGVTVEDYKYEKWEQGEFKGYYDSWKAVYTDDAVTEYEEYYYSGLEITDNTSYGEGVVFDFDGAAYTVNYELYNNDKEAKAKALSYLKKIIESLKPYEGADEDDIDDEDSAIEV